jgi:cyclic pyranopterin phosphate synthase
LREDELLSLESIARIARAGAALGIEKLRLTGGEPLVRGGIVGLARELALIPGVTSLGMTTNGTLLAPLAADLKEAGLDSVNVSLDTLDPDRYKIITNGGSLADVLAGLDAALEAGLEVKLNIVVAEDDPDDGAEAAAVEAYARARGASSQRIRRYDLARTKRSDPGFDRPPPCELCDRIRLLADGRLMACLHSEVFVKVDLGNIEESLLECVARKPPRGASCALLSVGQIGG